VLLSVLATTPVLQAALPTEVRSELTQMSKELRTVTRLVRGKKIEQARAIVARVSSRVAELDISETERSRTWIAFRRNLDKARHAIPVSFESQIARILTENCTRCHGTERNAAGLRLDTFNGLRAGGRNGPLLQPRNPANSRIMAKLTTNDEAKRMPRNRDRLPDAQLQLIAKWITDGAVFDGQDQSAAVGASAVTPKTQIDVSMADGSETVSFTKDVAPILVTFCLNCHRGNNPRGGFSVVTVTDLLRGGDTGDTVIPGNADDSYLWHLVGLQDPIKMPQGNSLLKRSQARTLKTWINEGARFDGDNSAATLRSIVPSQAESAASRLTSMSDADFWQRRVDQSASIWKQVAPRESATTVETDNFIIHGNVEADRLNDIAKQAEAQIQQLGDRFGSEDTVWRGRLIIFVCRDRFEYTEFNTVLRNRRTPTSAHGHAVLTPQLGDAYITFHDDTSVRDDELNSDQLLNALIAEAWLARDGSPLPSLVRKGFGVNESSATSSYFRQAQSQARRATAGLASPDNLFEDSALSPINMPATGVLFIRFLLTQGKPKFRQFVSSVRTGSTVEQALAATYGQPATAIAKAFLANIAR